MKHLVLPQGTIHYRDTGDPAGPTILFVHGLLTDHALWAPVVALLESSCRCIAPTWPFGSHTEAMAQDADLSPGGAASVVADFMAALDLQEVILVGNDTGGAVCQLVTQCSTRLRALVLTNCDAFEVFPPKGFGYLRPLTYVPGAMAAMGRALAASSRLRTSPLGYGSLAVSRLDSGLTRQWIRPSVGSSDIRRDLRKCIRGIRKEVTLAVAEQLPSFDKPAVLVWGSQDRLFPLSLGRRLEAILPNASLEVVPTAGAFVSIDAPSRVAEAITARFVGSRAM